jgi:hypothetical protein
VAKYILSAEAFGDGLKFPLQIERRDRTLPRANPSLLTTKGGVLNVVLDSHILFRTCTVRILLNPLLGALFSTLPVFATVTQRAVTGCSPLVIVASAPFTPGPLLHPGQQIAQLLFEFFIRDCHKDLRFEGLNVKHKADGVDVHLSFSPNCVDAVYRDRDGDTMPTPLDPLLALEAKVLTLLAFRNGPIEDIHAGKACPMCSGKPEFSRISDPEMKTIMMQAVNAMYRLLWQREHDPEAYLRSLSFGERQVHRWADPDPNMPSGERVPRT